MMIKRTIFKEIEKSVKSRPITLITGARQVGKSTIASLFIEKGFSYISLDNSRNRELAQRDPKLKNINNYGMYILTGSQMFRLMKNVSESMAGRVSIIHMLPLSRSEILNRDEILFNFDINKIEERARENPFNINDVFKDIVNGYFPEIYSNQSLNPERFFSDYVETYIERDINEIINIKDKFLFRKFMELLASLTGEELIYDNLSKIIGVDLKTIKSWISVLLAQDIIYLLEPYNEFSITKRIVKRPKIYFNDTGLACFLAKVNDPNVLSSSFLSGRFMETFIINELRKSYINNGKNPNFYYYRDNNMNEIDLIIINAGKIHLIECKSGMSYNSNYQKSTSGIICNTDSVYPLNKDVYVIPLSGI